MYKAPQYTDSNTLRKLDQLLNDVRSHGCPVILTGDINVHLDNPNDLQTASFNLSLVKSKMTQNLTMPTQIHGHTLDMLVTTDNAVDITDIVAEPISLSDHSLVMCSCQIKKLKKKVCR